MMWQNGWSAGGWVLMSLTMIVFWTLIVVGAVWFVRGSGNRQHRSDPGNPVAQRILDERFARGEVTEEEYRHRRELLDAR